MPAVQVVEAAGGHRLWLLVPTGYYDQEIIRQRDAAEVTREGTVGVLGFFYKEGRPLRKSLDHTHKVSLTYKHSICSIYVNERQVWNFQNTHISMTLIVPYFNFSSLLQGDNPSAIMSLTSTSDVHSRALDATSTDPWGPSHSLMEELRVYTQTRHCADILRVLHDALTSSGAHWRRVLKVRSLPTCNVAR